MHTRLLPSFISLAAVVAACSPDYESGKTRCSPDLRCPEGFVCTLGVCVLPGSTPAAGDGGQDALVAGPGADAGADTGGLDAVADSLVIADASPADAVWAGDVPGGQGGTDARVGAAMDAGVDASPAGSCTDPMFPVPCPARAGVPAACWSAGTDCTTVTLCGTEEKACRTGFTFDCAQNKCVVAMCTSNPEKPQYCPARGAYSGGCWSATTACSTIVECGEDIYACNSPDRVADCVADQCLPAAMCNYAAQPTPCRQCFAHKCCSLLNSCVEDATCGQTNTGPLWDALVACTAKFCEKECQ